MTSFLVRCRRRLLAVVIGAVLGSLLAVGGAFALDAEVHTSYLWLHGLRAEDNWTYNGHPFLESTDGANREAIAAWRHCPSGVHSGEARYISSHVHIVTDTWYRYMEAHTTSGQTGMSHHIHFRC